MEEEQDFVDVQVKGERRGQVMQIIFLFLLVAAIAALINATITIYKYKEMLSNPLGQNLENFGLDYCMCYDTDGKIVPVPSTSSNKTLQQLVNSVPTTSSPQLNPFTNFT